MAEEIKKRIDKWKALRSSWCDLLDIDEDALLRKKFCLYAKELKELRVAAIVDSFTEQCFAPECQLTQLTPQLWPYEIRRARPEIFFMESAWQGKEKSWFGKFRFCPQELIDICDYCREKNIPIIFWNKEDPTHYDDFIGIAQLADIIFTTDMDCVDKYQKKLGHRRVYLLPFAAQPSVHNPVEKYERAEKVCFAGSYYDKFPERCADFDVLADFCAMQIGLEIYDRNLLSPLPGRGFPERYLALIKGTLSPDEIDKAYKGYRFGLNINTVKNSRTMFARRVFELMASNTLVISNYSKGIKNFFGSLVICTDSRNTIDRKMAPLIADRDYADKVRLAALRKVLSEHLYEDRLDMVVRHIFGKSLKPAMPSVTCICTAIDTEERKRIRGEFSKQTYLHKSLVFVEKLTDKIGDICGDGYVGFWNANDWHGENYLTDLMLATRWGDYDAIGKVEYYQQENGRIRQLGTGMAYRTARQISLRRGIIKIEKVKSNTLSELRDGEWLVTGSCLAVDRFNYCSNYTEEKCSAAQDIMMDVGHSLTEIMRDGDGALAYQELLKAGNAIPMSNGGRYYKKYEVNIGIVCDEFMYQSFKDAANFVYITPDNWQTVVKKTELLLLVTSWHGLNGAWERMMYRGSDKIAILEEIKSAYRNNGKPVIFYSKEDPPNYNMFLPLAKGCDYIFTTCEEVISNYQRDTGCKRVFALPFCINPLYHNPIGIYGKTRENGVIFAGSWMRKYPQRGKDLCMIFDGILKSERDLIIINRNAASSNKDYQYPEKYRAYLYPAIEHETLQKVHKIFDYAVDINSVTDSRTMFANRGYELLAAGTIQISNYSLGVNDRLPMIHTVFDSNEVTAILQNDNREDIYSEQVAGVRFVMRNDTAADRVGQLLAAIGCPVANAARKVLVVVDRLDVVAQKMFDWQTYPERELVTIEELDEDKYCSCDIIAYWAADCFYDVFYLEDMVNAFKYADVDFVTKDAYYDGNILMAGKEHDFVDFYADRRRTIFWRSAYTREQIISAKAAGGHLGYSIDHFNYNTQHCDSVKKADYKLSVIIAVYNNGDRLLGKAFSSLKRSSIFADMEIILVDDGSTDNYTPKVVMWLEHNYPNVKACYYGDGGSGSASRPRNKGIELATARYVTYLDPDDEAICDGYAKLYSICVHDGIDIAIGERISASNKGKVTDHNNRFIKGYGSSDVESDGKNLLIKTEFSPCGIHTMLIRKSIILRNHIQQVVGAVGEDTLFYWELMLSANRIRSTSIPVHIYYDSVQDSTTNTINLDFFIKQEKICIPQKKFLKDNGLLKVFMELKFNYRYENLTLKRLMSAKEEEYADCAKSAYRIWECFKDKYNRKSEMINSFIRLCQKGGWKETREEIQKKMPVITIGGLKS